MQEREMLLHCLRDELIDGAYHLMSACRYNTLGVIKECVSDCCDKITVIKEILEKLEKQ